MKKEIQTSIHPAVDIQLLNTGYFSPIDYLLSSGSLDYSDYDAWRAGRIDVLDDALPADQQKTIELIRAMNTYACELGLEPVRQDWMAWHPAGMDFAKQRWISRNADLQSLLSVRFAPHEAHPQMDLFFSSPVAVATNDLISALLQHSSDAAALLEELSEKAPDHKDLRSFDVLVKALEYLTRPARGSQEELLLIEDQVLQIAPELLGRGWRDYVDGLWLWLAKARVSLPFDSAHPKLHASYLLAQARDWQGVCNSILEEDTWTEIAELGFRLAAAQEYLNQRNEVIKTWCHLVWTFPDLSESRLNLPGVAQQIISNFWQVFATLEDDQEEPLNCRLFPAWILIQEPGLSKVLNRTLADGEGDGRLIFRICHDLVAARLAGASEIDHRKALKEQAPGLLKHSLIRGSVG